MEKINETFNPRVALKTHLRCKIKFTTIPHVALTKCAKRGVVKKSKSVYIKKSTPVATTEVVKNLMIFKVLFLDRITFFLISLFIMHNQFSEHSNDKYLHT